MTLLKVRRRYVATASSLLPVIVCLMAVDGAAQSSGDAPITLLTKFDTATDHPLVQTVINGASFWCAMDTGFSRVMAMDRTMSVKAGLVESAGQPTPDGNPPYRGDGSANADVHFGSAVLRNQLIVIRDFARDQSDMDCVIGPGLLRQYVIEFDNITPRIRLHDRTQYKPPAHAVEVPLIFRTNPNVPFVKVELELPDGTRRQVQTLVDTGTAYYALALIGGASASVRDRLPVAERPARPVTGSGAVHLVAARPKAITVGAFTVQAPVIALVDSGVSAANDDGLLGCGFLNRFTIGFDLEGRRMYLAPNKRFRDEMRFDASGAGFHRTQQGFEVEVVLPDSPAARADLRAGDTLVSIDGKSAASVTLSQLKDMLSRPGTTRDLRLMRMGKLVQVHLVLQRRL